MILPVALCAIMCSSTSHLKKRDKVCWNADNKLEWKDFKGKVPMQKTAQVAYTTVNIKYSILTKKSIKVKNCFLKSESWVRENCKRPNILLHEQYHFNIAEIYSRQMRREMQQIGYPSTENVQAIFDKWIIEYHKEQTLYDFETNHSKITIEQQRWQNKIDSTLEVLSIYSNEIVFLNEEKDN